MIEWVGGMSLVWLQRKCKNLPVTKNGKPINEGKRQKTWGLDLETSSELELDGGQGTPQASGPWGAMGTQKLLVLYGLLVLLWSNFPAMMAIKVKQ